MSGRMSIGSALVVIVMLSPFAARAVVETEAAAPGNSAPGNTATPVAPVAVPPEPGPAVHTDSPSVLILNSYHRGYDWSDAEMSAIEDIFSAKRPDVNLFFEHLDAKRIPWTPARQDVIAEALAAQYRGVNFSAIIVADDIAYQFMLSRRDEIFPGVPVVFCGVNYFDPAEIASRPWVTGVVQSVDFGANVRTIRSIIPSVRKIWVLVDGSITGRAYRRAFESDTTIPADIQVEFLDGSEITWSELLAKLAVLPADSAVLKLLWLENSETGYMTPETAYPRIAAASTVPVFQVTESGLGLGLAGGVMVTGRSQGRRAALMVLDLLSGQDIRKIGVMTHPEVEFRIDWPVLARQWKVSRQAYDRLVTMGGGQDLGRSAATATTGSRIRICMSNEPVVSQYNIVTGGFTGLAFELLEIVASRAGWKMSYVFSEPDRMLAALNSGRCDAALTQGTDDETLDKLDLSTETLYSNWGAVYVQGGSSIAGLRDLDGRTVALVVDSAYSSPFERQVDSIGLAVSYVWVDSYAEAVDMLVARKVDAAVIGRLHPVSPREAARIELTDIIIYPVGQHLAVLKGAGGNLLGAFDRHLSDLKRDTESDYGKILGRYTYRRSVQWVPFWVWLILAALLIALIFVAMLRREVDRKTRALAEREENIRVVLDSISDGVVATDKNGLVRDVNPIATVLTGWDGKDAAGQALYDVVDLVDAETGEPRRQWLAEVLSGNVVRMSGDGCPSLLSRRGGRLRVEVSASPIRDDVGLIQGAAVVFRDVTESLRTEEIRRQSQKMEAIGQLAGGIAHDFNNVLGGVIGIAEFLVSRYREDPTIIKYCGYIVDSGHRASLMIRRLLDFARMGRAESLAVSVNSVVAAAVEILKGSIQRNIEIVLSTGASPDVIIGDAAQIENLVLNLGINARDAMPDGGRIDVSTTGGHYLPADTRIGRFVLAEGNYLKLTVGDTGVGISPSIRDKIFEPFFSTKATGKGTGLGLAAVMGIVEEHQGAVEVESRPDGGSLFSIYLPLTGESTKVEPEVPAACATNYQGVVLVIDDEPIIRTMAEVLLTESGFDVITAADGREGVDVYTRRHDEIDVVLLDFIMPVMDGLATLAALREIDPGVKVVIASGFTSDHRKQSLLDAGALDAVNKPFSQQEICSALISAINHH